MMELGIIITHGRRSVAGLNRTDGCLWGIPVRYIFAK